MDKLVDAIIVLCGILSFVILIVSIWLLPVNTLWHVIITLGVTIFILKTAKSILK